MLRYPGDPEAWLRLARFQLEALDQPRMALSTVRGALYLDPKGTRPAELFLQARAASRAQALEDARVGRGRRAQRRPSRCPGADGGGAPPAARLSAAQRGERQQRPATPAQRDELEAELVQQRVAASAG